MSLLLLFAGASSDAPPDADSTATLLAVSFPDLQVKPRGPLKVQKQTKQIKKQG